MKTYWHEVLLDVEPPEELWGGPGKSVHRILVPTALDDASTLALGYASALASRFDAELALLYVLPGPASAESSRLEAELWRCLSGVRAQHPKARLFLRAGLVCEQVKAVAASLGADLVVTSQDYHRRFLSWLNREAACACATHGVSCPIVLVNAAVFQPEAFRKESDATLVSPLGSPRGTRYQAARRRQGRSLRLAARKQVPRAHTPSRSR